MARLHAVYCPVITPRGSHIRHCIFEHAITPVPGHAEDFICFGIPRILPKVPRKAIRFYGSEVIKYPIILTTKKPLS